MWYFIREPLGRRGVMSLGTSPFRNLFNSIFSHNFTTFLFSKDQIDDNHAKVFASGTFIGSATGGVNPLSSALILLVYSACNSIRLRKWISSLLLFHIIFEHLMGRIMIPAAEDAMVLESHRGSQSGRRKQGMELSLEGIKVRKGQRLWHLQRRWKTKCWKQSKAKASGIWFSSLFLFLLELRRGRWIWSLRSL